jgi:hypothetical protein
MEDARNQTYTDLHGPSGVTTAEIRILPPATVVTRSAARSRAPMTMSRARWRRRRGGQRPRPIHVSVGPSALLAGQTSFPACARSLWRGPGSLIPCAAPRASGQLPSIVCPRSSFAGHSPSPSVHRRERQSHRRCRWSGRHPRAVTPRLCAVSPRVRAARHRVRRAREECRRVNPDIRMRAPVAGLHD